MAAKQTDTPSGPKVPAPPVAGVDLTSVAGEEDPGASLDLPIAKSMEGRAPAGTPSAGENLCPQCGGTGRLGASACPHCQGTGVMIVGLGGA